jgi:hypothetical protein
VVDAGPPVAARGAVRPHTDATCAPSRPSRRPARPARASLLCRSPRCIRPASSRPSRGDRRQPHAPRERGWDIRA